MFNPDFKTMKKLVLSATLLLSVATFAQKDELKILKKIYSKETISEKDLEVYKSANSALLGLAKEEEDKVYSNFYNGMLPIVEITSLGGKATPADQLRLMNKNNLEGFTNAVLSTLEYEKKSGKKVFTDDINETLTWLKPLLSQAAFQLNSTAKYKEASSLFYSLYTLDKAEGINLENAAMLAYQGQDYKNAEILLLEFLNSDYLQNGMVYFATNKLSKNEENFPSKAHRDKMVALGSHEKSRDEKVSKRKPEFLKMYAELVAFSGDLEKAKNVYKEAIALNPNDLEMLINESKLYYQSNDIETYQKLVSKILERDPNNAILNYNLGYIILGDDSKIVDEINANLKNKKKYDELVIKRKQMFEKALPFFEKSYAVDKSNENTKIVLRLCYENLGQPEKAKAIN